MNFGRLLDWFQLLRVANFPGAASNVLVGYLLVKGTWQPWPLLLLAIAVSLSFYAAGILGNDLADLEQDRARRPERALPSGRIPAATARVVMWLLLGTGLTLAIGLDLSTLRVLEERRPLPVSGVALLLGISIFLYNRVLKRWLVSVVAMGACRGLNLLLGVSLASRLGPGVLDPGSAVTPWIAASGLALFVCGITLLARDESSERPRRTVMGMGVLCLAGGMALNAWLPGWLVLDGVFQQSSAPHRNHLLLVLVIAFTVLRSSLTALVTLDPARIGNAIRISLLSVITLDAAVALLASGGRPVYAGLILGLLGLGLLLRRVSNPT